ncbi:hypothetical protein [Pseudoclavibacter sp. RFBA6]|uniref:hypothetical protein n=1 Tax=Pseudoclavibacter sp. RFBA6 TaxID=2080573 RepID=UPI000CE7F66A|nr:hypothetical protein [Pseudoclavibacter sp. RFBA6]PPG39432.1 hypothetical protein C5C17_11600 [Pseudoclavibacter sp. RFBA6]
MTNTPSIERVDPLSLNTGDTIRFEKTGPDYRVETIEILGEHARVRALTVAPTAGGSVIDALPHIGDRGCYQVR